MVFKKENKINSGRTPWNKGKKGLQIGWNKGIPCSKETKRKVSETKKRLYREGKLKPPLTCFKKGSIPWNKGKKGLQISWLKGLTKETDERVKKISENMKGRKITWNKKQSETRKRLYKEGKLVPIWKGKHLTEEAKKKISETKKRLIKGGKIKKLYGENNPAWKGGISFEPYGLEFNDKLKFQIRKRDNFTCQECHFTEEQLGHKLDVHHINFCKTDNHPNNLISLCQSCHGQTNFNRGDWTNYYQNKLSSVEVIICQ